MILRVRCTTALARSFGNLLKCEHSSNRSICSVTGKCLKSGPVQKVLISKPNYCLSSKINTSTRHPRGWNIFNRTIYSVFLNKIDVNMQTENAPVHKIVVRTMAKKASKSKSKAKKVTIDADMAEGIIDIDALQGKMENVLENMTNDFATKIPDRITIGFIDNVMVKTANGKKLPLYQIALVKAKSDHFTIEIQENFPNAAKAISSAIAETGFNLVPQVRGDTVILPIPMFSQDQRTNIAKIAKSISEQAKADLRKVRQKGMSDIRKNKEGESKDLIRRIENMVQQLADYYTERIEFALEAKNNEIVRGKSK